MTPTFNRIVQLLRKEAYLRTGNRWWLKQKAMFCDQADREHLASERQFCHVGHRFGDICCARATESLSLGYKLGLAVHEFGHLAICGPRMVQVRHTESDANRAGKIVTGVKVVFRGPLILEWSSPVEWRRFE